MRLTLPRQKNDICTEMKIILQIKCVLYCLCQSYSRAFKLRPYNVSKLIQNHVTEVEIKVTFEKMEEGDEK